MVFKNYHSLAISNIKTRFFNNETNLDVIAKDYCLEKIISTFLIIFDVDHPNFENNINRLEEEFGSSDILYNLPQKGHPLSFKNFQDRLYIFDYEISEREIYEYTDDSVLAIEKFDFNKILTHAE